MELNDILKEEPQEEVKQEVPQEEAQPEVEKPQSRRKAHQDKEQRARDEGGKFVKEEQKEEPKAEVKEEPKPEKQEMSEKERAFLATVQEERRKRQELERRLAQIEQAKPKEEAKTFWDDPEGHLTKFQQQILQQQMAGKLQTSEAIARSRYKDFDDNVQVFAEVLQSTPGLHAQWLQSPDPAEFAYRLGKHTKEVRDAGSIDALREKIAKEERLKLEAEFKKKNEEFERQRQELTPSLSDVRGASRRTQPVFTGPTPLEDILASK